MPFTKGIVIHGRKHSNQKVFLLKIMVDNMKVYPHTLVQGLAKFLKNIPLCKENVQSLTSANVICK